MVELRECSDAVESLPLSSYTIWILLPAVMANLLAWKSIEI